MFGIPIRAHTQHNMTNTENANATSSLVHGLQCPFKSFLHINLAFKHPNGISSSTKIDTAVRKTFARVKPEIYDGHSIGLTPTFIIPHLPKLTPNQIVTHFKMFPCHVHP